MKITITATGSENLGMMGHATADHDHPPEALQRAARAMRALVPDTDPDACRMEVKATPQFGLPYEDHTDRGSDAACRIGTD